MPIACPTSSGWRPASSVTTTSAASSGPLVLERGPATSPLFGAFFAAVEQAGLTLTDDVNGYRQEGFGAFDRNIHRGRRLTRGASLPASGDGSSQPGRPDPGLRHEGHVRGMARRRGRVRLEGQPGAGRGPAR